MHTAIIAVSNIALQDRRAIIQTVLRAHITNNMIQLDGLTSTIGQTILGTRTEDQTERTGIEPGRILATIRATEKREIEDSHNLHTTGIGTADRQIIMANMPFVPPAATIATRDRLIATVSRPPDMLGREVNPVAEIIIAGPIIDREHLHALGIQAGMTGILAQLQAIGQEEDLEEVDHAREGFRRTDRILHQM